MFATYSAQEAANKLGFDRHRMKTLRDEGLLLGIKTGESWRYSEKELQEFWEKYKGSDMSNDEQIRITAALSQINTKGDRIKVGESSRHNNRMSYK